MQKQPKIGARFIYADVSTVTDCTVGKIYTIERYHPKSGNAQFRDDVGDWNSGAAPSGRGRPTFLVGDYVPLKDIQGMSVIEGDTIAYAFAGAQSRHLALFEVQQINGPVALCRAKSDGAVINLGVFEERAIKINS